MNDDRNCCPFCKRTFDIADNMDIDDYFAKNVITAFAEIQKIGFPMPCPRCGKFNMSMIITKNSLSRQADIYVCEVCGMDEGMRAFRKMILPMFDWWIIRELMESSQE